MFDQLAQTDVMASLRQETASQHRAIEEVVPLTSPDLTFEGYIEYLASALRFYAPLEEKLRGVPGLAAALPDIEWRWKTESLLTDLLGCQPTLDPVSLPEVTSLAQAFGVLYVLEGSTLGGQILVRLLRDRLGDQAEGRLRFLNSYGAQVGTMWKAFCESARQNLRLQRDHKEAIEAAQATFAAFHALLEQMQENSQTAVGTV